MVLIIEFHPHQTLFAKIWLCCMHIFNSMSISTPVCYNLTTIWPLGATTNVLRLADVRKKIIWANISSSVRLSSLTVRLETWDTRMKLRDDESLWTDIVSAYEWSSFQNSKVKINCYQPQQPYSHVTGQFIYKQKPEHLWYQHRIFFYRLHWCADIFIETI